MKFDYIEIGTSDFETMCQEHPNLVGLSIEPLDIYCNRLPAQENLIRVNCAISNFKGHGVVWYVHPDDIDAYDLPQWLKGCNSFNSIHPSTKAELDKRELSHLLRFKYVEVLTWKDLVARYDITQVNYLKIDTEGLDFDIIKTIDFNSINIKLIKTEHEHISDQGYTLEEMVDFLKENNYIIEIFETDIVAIKA
jgi:FkbM family methyltransferase